MQGLFITGTDTGVGKTRLTCAIARQWRGEARAFVVRKPVSTGGNDDAVALALASGQLAADITPHVFREPAAPPVAAAREGRRFDLADAIAVFPPGEKTLLVEGVGGLMCPLTARETVADLAVWLGLPLVVVARRSLGTLNHTLLTLEAARQRRLRVAGVVVSETEPVAGLAQETALDEMRKRGVPVLGVIPHGGDLVPDIDWWSLASS